MSSPFWTPVPRARETTRLGRFITWTEEAHGLTFADYGAFWQWSVDELEQFWSTLWDYADVMSDGAPTTVLASRQMPGAVWFPGTALNWAEHVLRPGEPDEICMIAYSQTRPEKRVTRAELDTEVARVAAALRRFGVRRGDRVFAYLPNIPEAVVALLATASIGAIWSAAPPEFGIQSVLDRAGQIEPTVLLAVDGYRYGNQAVDRRDEIGQIRAALPSLAATVVVPYLRAGAAAAVPDCCSWDDLRADDVPLTIERVPFDHPLWILFSSGTTGPPKAIMHGHGGIVLEHFKIGALMHDLGPDDRYLAFATTGWMVWNRLVSTLLTGACIVLVDGDPRHPELDSLFAIAERAGVTVWGASSAYLALCQRAGVRPNARYDLSRLRTLVAAGSSCPPEVYDFVREAVQADLLFYEGSGGTDVCTGFVSGTPLTPVTRGEIPARMPGVQAEAYDSAGHAVLDEPGELVITKPMPSMPVAFWNDPDGEVYRAAYFDTWPGVWRHGDRFLLTGRGTSRILGRSDATLNRGGVRLGTGEFYSVVEAMPQIADSLVVHVRDDAADEEELVLLVVLRDGLGLSDALREQIRTELRRERSPRHVPGRIEQISAVPRTNSGKKLEVPVKKILAGAHPADVASLGSITHVEALWEIAGLRPAMTTEAPIR
jgi:acetoacetyl-CoA synthetase